MFRANVLKVMIASPGDVAPEREIVTQEIYRWNDANASARNIVLLPIKWETHSTPEQGSPPQTIINRQLLEDADIVIGIFGTKIGTPTEEYVSGTVEEIKRHVASGKTAKLYFSDVPIPPSQVNETQLHSLREFKEECRSTGLYATFDDLNKFSRDLAQHLSIELNQPRYKWLAAIEQKNTEVSQSISDAALRLLKAVAKTSDGTFILQESLGGYGLRINDEEFIDGTPRSVAKWRAAISELNEIGLIETVHKNIYRLTDAGYVFADHGAEPESAPEPNAFELLQTKHIRESVQSLTYLQRDFLRLALVKGGEIGNQVYSHALKPQQTVDWNGLTIPLVQKGFITAATDLRSGTTTVTVTPALREVLSTGLFPRDEEHPPVLDGI